MSLLNAKSKWLVPGHECRVMQSEWSALLVHDNEDPVGGLAAMLEAQSVKTSRVKTCHEAAQVLAGAELPRLVFTDTALPDGTWKDVLSIAARGRQAVKVIVVARFWTSNFT
jgi:DNA-binding NtrC family response regulator